MDSPLFPRNRLRDTEQNIPPAEPIAEHAPQNATKLLDPIFNVIKLVVGLIKPDSKDVDGQPTVQDNSNFEQEEEDEDEELDSVIITNDYHLIFKAADNSILEDDPEETPGPSSQPTSVFNAFLEARLSKSKPMASTQYGTDLSKALGYLTSSAYQQHYKPEISTLTLHDPQDDNYKETVERFYAQPPPSEDFSELDALVANYNIEDTISSKYSQKHKDLVAKVDQEKQKSQSSVATLGPQQLENVNKIWQSRGNFVVVSKFNIDITSNDLKTLRDGKWLNDNIIDFYLSLITAADPKVYGWTTHFFTTLQSKGYQGVARWAKRKKINLLKLDVVLVPINVSNTHWALACIDNVNCKIEYIDSLTTTGNFSAVKLLDHYMAEESKRLNMDPIKYELLGNVRSPQQNNGSDCGVFTCTNALYRARRKQSSFSQKDMKSIRRRMAYEIITSKLLT